jgi:competence protein ComEA
MTLLKYLAINLVMLGVTVGIAYWALDHEEPRPLLPASVTRTGSELATKTQTDALPPAPAATSIAPVTTSSPPARPQPGVRQTPRRPVIFPINLNTAKMEEFTELPGIGEKLAERIVAYRRVHGRFRTVEDLREVKGIGKKRMERLRPLITITAHD